LITLRVSEGDGRWLGESMMTRFVVTKKSNYVFVLVWWLWQSQRQGTRNTMMMELIERILGNVASTR
jgi:hypothetical protein